MPRAFSESERERIEQRLLDAGRELFERQGLRKTNVAELARAAGIGKGSFYLFFPTKEDLFLALTDRFEREAKQALVDRLEVLIAEGVRGPELLRSYFVLQFELLETHPFLRILADPEQAEALMHKVSPERVAAEVERDASYFAELIADWQRRGLVDPSVDPRAASALSRAVFALIQGRGLIGEQDWPGMLELLIDALARRLAGTAPSPEEQPT